MHSIPVTLTFKSVVCLSKNCRINSKMPGFVVLYKDRLHRLKKK